MALTPLMLTFLTLNANGLHDDAKWHDLWYEIPRADIIYVQESYLDVSQEYAFGLYAQGYDMHYSHSTSNSGSVFIAIKHKVGVIVAKVTKVPS